jgi:glycosyltransferase involved in cell wall biosynthesis
MKISGLIITLNEEKNIEKCIRSMLLVCDDIVVVDSLSNDKTKEIYENDYLA